MIFWPASGQEEFFPNTPDATMLIAAMTMTRTWAITNWDFRKHPEMTLHELALRFMKHGDEVTDTGEVIEEQSYILDYVAQFPPVVNVTEIEVAA